MAPFETTENLTTFYVTNYLRIEICFWDSVNKQHQTVEAGAIKFPVYLDEKAEYVYLQVNQKGAVRPPISVGSSNLTNDFAKVKRDSPSEFPEFKCPLSDFPARIHDQDIPNDNIIVGDDEDI